MKFEKAVKEVDRLLRHCDTHRASIGKINEQIEALKKKQKVIEKKWNSYSADVTSARDVISETLKEKYSSSKPSLVNPAGSYFIVLLFLFTAFSFIKENSSFFGAENNSLSDFPNYVY